MHEALTRRVTRGEFIAELARRGHARSARWHESWIEAGLIDRGEPEGRAGGGVIYRWPYLQIEHADVLLDKVAEGAALGVLANYVIWTWMWWRDEWMPLRQVRRAMRTWAEAERLAPVKNVRASARDLVETVAHPRAGGKRRLVRALVDFPATGDSESLRDTFDDVFDPM